MYSNRWTLHLNFSEVRGKPGVRSQRVLITILLRFYPSMFVGVVICKVNLETSTDQDTY